MLDINYFKSSKTDVQLYETPGSWYTWVKPRSAKMINIFCMSGGAGGGAGGTAGSGAPGPPGNMIRAIFPSTNLPDILYVWVGAGGAGGIGAPVSSSGSPGGLSYVSVIPDSSSFVNNVCVSAGATGTGGGVGTGVGGTAATVQPATTALSASFLHLATFAITTLASAGAGITTLATNYTPTSFVSQGTMGGGNATGATARNGGNINSTNLSPAISGGIGTTTASATGGRGSDGVAIYYPTLFFTGGAGGGNSKGTGGIGGAGGNGATGCGGGGGGGGTLYGGNGGNGGDGLVIITTTI